MTKQDTFQWKIWTCNFEIRIPTFFPIWHKVQTETLFDPNTVGFRFRLRNPGNLCSVRNLPSFSSLLIHILRVVRWLLGTKHADPRDSKTFPRIQNTSQNPKTLPRIQICFGFWEVFGILGCVFGFWDMFWILGSVFGFWEVFWILGSAFGFWEVF